MQIAHVTLDFSKVLNHALDGNLAVLPAINISAGSIAVTIHKFGRYGVVNVSGLVGVAVVCVLVPFLAHMAAVGRLSGSVWISAGMGSRAL